MIRLEESFENPRQKLDIIVAWIEEQFENVDPRYKSVLVDYVNAWYNSAFNAHALLSDSDNRTLRENHQSQSEELQRIESELLGYGLRSQVEEIKRKVLQLGGLV